ncbi:hypothetical protein ScalyP_jg4708 [Parmales sp. scaly parma]|nr:hypothetical protein ScalyP_jg4708 [Parmales sp. scaly parma]
MNPYVERGAENENDNDEDEDEIDETTYLPKDPDLLGFFVFCTVLVQKRWRGNKTRKFLFRERHGKDALHIQKRWRGNRSRNAARKLVAKTIRKTFEGGHWIYEDVTTKQIFFERPVVFKYLFPNSKF